MPVSDVEIRDHLERTLRRPIAALRRRPCPYTSSHALEEVDVAFHDGEPLGLVLKDLAPAALSAEATTAKSTPLLDPAREVAAYRDILAPAGVDVPVCYAAGDDHWLLLEHVEGVPLWQTGEMAAWDAAARWLALLHSRGAPAARRRLVAYDAAYLRLRLGCALDARRDVRLERLASRWEQVV